MPAYGGDHRAAGIDAGTASETVVDRLFEGEGRSAEIANRGEPARERAFSLLAGGEKDVAHIRSQQAENRQPRKDRVPVRIDEARHDCPAAAVDHPRAFGGADVARLDRLDAIPLDEQAESRTQCARTTIEQSEIREHDGRRGPLRRSVDATRESKGRKRGAHSRHETRRERPAVIRRLADWTSGAQQAQPLRPLV